MAWKKSAPTLISLSALHVLSDKYAHRYIEELDHRCVAYKYFIGTATYSDKVAFWYVDFATRADAIQMAKNWLQRGELAVSVESLMFDFATHVQPYRYNPELEKRGW